MARRGVAIFAVAVLVVVTACAASSLTLAVSGRQASAQGEGRSDYARLDEIMDYIRNNYYENVTDEALIEGALRGLFINLDPYSFYYTAEEMQAMIDDSEGEYYGIGVLVTLDGEGAIAIARVYEGPARDAGLLPGDKIIGINGEAVSAFTQQDLTDATSRIKAPTEGPVMLTILRAGERFDVSVARANVETNRTRTAILEGNVGYLEISGFYGDDVSGTRAALSGFAEAGVEKLVLDLRGNTGGDFSHVLQIADMLLPEGVIVSETDRRGVTQEHNSDAQCYSFSMVVLVNGYSASASEILAGALQDYGVGVIMGTQTYGKGVVQDVIVFHDDGAGFQLTTSQYFTPKGNAVQGIGITPDVVVELSEDYDPANYSIDPGNDNQLREALALLAKP